MVPNLSAPCSQNSLIMSTKNKKDNTEIINTVNGTMTFCENDNRQKLLDFMCTEYVELEPFIADCKVQGMRDGNVTLGRDGRYYFVFTLPKERVRELPDKLVHQALAIAQKVTKMNTKRGGRK